MDKKTKVSFDFENVVLSELDSYTVIALINRELLWSMGELVGDATINECRVLNAVLVSWLTTGSPSGVTAISSDMGMSKSNVSRQVSNLIAKGILKEEHDADDRRKRWLSISESAMEKLVTLCERMPVVSQLKFQ